MVIYNGRLSFERKLLTFLYEKNLTNSWMEGSRVKFFLKIQPIMYDGLTLGICNQSLHSNQEGFEKA